MPNGKPDPNCSECKGKGQIILLTSSKICDCVDRKPVPPYKYKINKDALSQFKDYVYKDYSKKF